jgi:hypothetical protein
MTNISITQSRQRFQKISAPLQDAIFSIQTAEIIQQVCQKNNISDDKVPAIGKITGLVLLGFMHPEDMADALSGQMGVSSQVAKAIVGDLTPRLFTPLKTDLDKAYAPLPHEGDVVVPKIMQEIKPPTVAQLVPTKPATPAAPAPKIISQTFDAASLTVGATPLSFNKDRPVPASKPVAPSTQGWSKQSPQQPVVKLGQVSPTIPAPAKIVPPPTATPAPATPTPAPTKPAAPRVGNAMSEFDRLDLIKKAPAPMATPAPQPAAVIPAKPAPLPPKPSEPAPVMLHQISGTTAISQSPNLGMAAGTKNQIGANLPPITSPTKPAVLEFSGKAPAPSSAAKVVHYSEYKTPVPPPIPASDGPRQVTQIVPPSTTQSPAPKTVTTAPPAPPKPQPPTPTIAGAQKVIVKDFLS